MSSSYSKCTSSESSNTKCTNKKNEIFLKFKHLKELSNVKTQLDLNAELNKKAATILNSLKVATSSNVTGKKENSTGGCTGISKKQQEIFNLDKSGLPKKRGDILSVNKNLSKINNDLISYVKLRQNYMQHDNYWKQSWVFTDNPVYEYEISQGFENPAYLFGIEERHIAPLSKKSNKDFTRAYQLNYLNNLINTFETNRKRPKTFCHSSNSSCSSSSSEVMNIYEDIFDLDQNCKQVLSTSSSSILSSSSNFSGIINTQENKIIKESYKNSEFEISSPESNDSGIHSDDRLNRHVSSTDIMESLYSSITNSSKKSGDLKENESNFESNEEIESDSQIVHVEQHALPMGWIRCCDDTGIYYWHKPSGTVTRKPPNVQSPINSTTLTPPEKNFSIKEFVNSELFKKFTESTSSEVSSSSSTNKLSQIYEDEQKFQTNNQSNSNLNKHLKDPENASSKMCSSDFSSSSASSSMSSSYCSTQNLENKIKNNTTLDTSSLENSKSKLTRFYVRSLGWVKIDESDLTPERSSKAVNKCINDLSRGIKDINDVVARWGQGKDLYMDLQDNILLLIDPIDEKILNKQSITSIRVWGVGRDNGRDFAYVARDKKTNIHMCHVFRCDSAPAKEIANSLRDICKSILNEKKQIAQENAPKLRTTSNLLRRPNFLPDLSTNNNSNLNKRKSSVNSVDEIRDTSNFPKPMDEPKKTIRCRYLGSTQVLKPSGIDVLNAGIEKIYVISLEEYKRAKRQQIKKLKNSNRNDDFSERKNRLDTDEEEDDYDDFDLDQNTTISFDNMLDLNSEKNLGIECDVVVSPSKIEVNQNSENSILECRTRYLSFMGISNDVRLCGFIMHCIDNTFKCHAFMCENSSGSLCKTIEAACKLRYQKCLDAHPETLTQTNVAEINKQNQPRLGYLGSQIRNMFDSIKYRNLFSNISKSNK